MKEMFYYFLKEKNLNNVFILLIEDEEILLRVLKNARVVIGGRMHSVIISHILGANAHTINQNNKIKSFSEKILLENPEKIREKLTKSIETVLYEELNFNN